MSREVHLHIDELVLVGVPHTQRHVVAEALERELTRLLAGPLPKTLTRSGSHDALDAGRIAAPSSPASLGLAAARATFAALGPPGGKR